MSFFGSMDTSPMDRTDPPTLLDLPRELLHNIVLECNPSDIASISRACQTLHNFVLSDNLLYKEVYLRHYDPPQNSWEDDNTSNYEAALKDFTRLRKVLFCTRVEDPAKFLSEHLIELGAAIDRLISSSSVPKVSQEKSKNISVLSKAFRQRTHKKALAAQSSLYVRAKLSSPKKALTSREDIRQASAKLHVLYGCPIDPIRHDGKDVRMDTYARSVVYDLRRYTTESLWGPFKSDNTQDVDWEKVEAIMLVIQFNLRQFHHRTRKRFPLLWHHPWAGIRPRSFVSPKDWHVRKHERELAAKEAGEPLKDEETLQAEAEEEALRTKDPYNVTGTWMRVVCFLDYSDLYAYNFTDMQPDDREPRRPLRQEEAIRLITMKIKATKVEPGGENQAAGSLITHFEGTSRSMHVGWDPNANSGIREWALKGTASTTPEGQVRWTSFSVFHGEERWRSEGIQVGGIQSARGVWGSWFDKDFDREGPAGPTAFWKLTDELPKEPEQKGRDGSIVSSAIYGTAPLYHQHNRHHHHGHITLGTATAAGVFGAAMAPLEQDEEDGYDAYTDALETAAAQLVGSGVHDDFGNVVNSEASDNPDPYNQTVLTGLEYTDEDEDEMLEIEHLDEDDEDDMLEEDEDELLDFEYGNDEVGDTIALPASSILQILDAASSEEEGDGDYTPPAGGSLRRGSSESEGYGDSTPPADGAEQS